MKEYFETKLYLKDIKLLSVFHLSKDLETIEELLDFRYERLCQMTKDKIFTAEEGDALRNQTRATFKLLLTKYNAIWDELIERKLKNESE